MPHLRSWALWLVWSALVFGLFNVCEAPAPGLADAKATQSASASTVQKLLRLNRDDFDLRRYFAYANAVLGRPYDGYYVRSGADRAKPEASEHRLVSPERALTPWRDFVVEYPPGMLAAALPPALLTDDFTTYFRLFSLEMGVLLTAAVAFSVRSAEKLAPGKGPMALLTAILFVGALGVVSVRRYDAAVALALAAALQGLLFRAPLGAGVWTALGGLLKGAPLLAAPFGLAFLARVSGPREALRGAVVGLCVLGAGLGLYLALAGPRAADVLTYHAERPVQVESPYGAALLIARGSDRAFAHVESSYGSDNVVGPLEPALRRLGTILPAAAACLAFAWLWRALRGGSVPPERALIAAVAVAFLGAIAFGKVFSPQYLLWLLPTAGLAAALGSERSRVLLVAAAAAAQVEYPFVYQLDAPWVMTALAVVALMRDGLLVASAASLIADASPKSLAAPIAEAQPA